MSPLDRFRFVRDFPPDFIGSNGKLCLFALVSRCTPRIPVCYPSYRKLAEDTGLSTATIKRTIKMLDEAGLIERQRRFKRSTIYRLLFDEWLAANPGALRAARESDALLMN